jgi:SAF domain
MSIDTEPRAKAPRPWVRTAHRPVPVVTDELPRLPGRRNPRWIALGIVALCLGALLSYVIYARVASETTVVSAARTVYRGQVLQRADLTTVRLRAGTLPDTVPATDLERLVGQRAAFDLPAGGVVAGAAVASSPLPAEGRAAVGLKLATGRAPEALLLPSSPVRLVALPPASTEAAADDKLAGKTYPARVIDHASGADGVSLVLDVDVASGQAPTIALLGAQDRLAVVRDAGR